MDILKWGLGIGVIVGLLVFGAGLGIDLFGEASQEASQWATVLEVGGLGTTGVCIFCLIMRGIR